MRRRPSKQVSLVISSAASRGQGTRRILRRERDDAWCKLCKRVLPIRLQFLRSGVQRRTAARSPRHECPAELYTASTRRYDGLPDLTYPFHDRDVLVTACGRLCLHRKRINISTVLAGQRLGIKEVDDD